LGYQDESFIVIPLIISFEKDLFEKNLFEKDLFEKIHKKDFIIMKLELNHSNQKSLK